MLRPHIAALGRTLRPREGKSYIRTTGPLRSFAGKHPDVMAERVRAEDWPFDPAAFEQRVDYADHSLPLIGEHARRFVRYFIPATVKNGVRRSADALRALGGGDE